MGFQVNLTLYEVRGSANMVCDAKSPPCLNPSLLNMGTGAA